jgi:hypothetical protein
VTNFAAVIGLSFDSTDIQQNPIGIFLEIKRGLYEGPEVRGEDTVVPARTGRIARNRMADRWVIELEGYVSGLGSTEDAQREHFLDLADIIGALFDPTAMPATLQAEMQDGGTRTIEARTLPTVLWNQVVPSMAKVNIQLEAVEPWVVTVAGS